MTGKMVGVDVGGTFTDVFVLDLFFYIDLLSFSYRFQEMLPHTQKTHLLQECLKGSQVGSRRDNKFSLCILDCHVAGKNTRLDCGCHFLVFSLVRVKRGEQTKQ